MIAIIDYDAGNLRSVQKAVEFIGESVVVTREPKVIQNADHVILPGVGAFGDAMGKLDSFGLSELIGEIAARGTPLLGICLGLQLLFETSEESKGVRGLSLLKGEIQKIPENKGLKIPHIGWNSLKIQKNARLFQGIDQEAYVYFVHSYYLKAARMEEVAATTEYGVEIHASVQKDNIYACQFHPEKSGEIGLQILKNFAAIH